MRSFALTLVACASLVLATLAGCKGDEPTCASPSSDCGGICANLSVDPLNCGTCGNACPMGQVCSAGMCALGCGGGTTECGGGCVDTQVDPSHCGACDAACADGELCQLGSCTVACSGGTTACGGGCVDTQVDPDHCGACDAACSDEEVCSAGSCGPFCTGGTVDCDGSCVDTSTDESNCGGCGTACELGQTCDAGTCTDICDSAATYCSGRCVDTQTDVRNCGACGTVCTLSEDCNAGTCEATPETTVLVFYDDPAFSGDVEPAIVAADALGYTVQAVFEDGPDFATAYASRTWDLVVIDSSYLNLPAEIFPIITARTDADLPIVVAYYDLDGEPALAADLEVTATNYGDPEPISVATGASPNLFTYSTTITGPLIHDNSYADDGDYLALTGTGENLLVGDDPSEVIAVATNARSSVVLGFLISNYRDSDVDGDGTNDMVELFTNIMEWYADGTP